jgi:hypothetical protein
MGRGRQEVTGNGIVACGDERITYHAGTLASNKYAHKLEGVRGGRWRGSLAATLLHLLTGVGVAG